MRPDFSVALVLALNHMLAREPWASGQLRAHADKVARIDLSVLSLGVRITPEGLLATVADDVPSNVTIRINPADLPLIVQDRQRAIAYVKLEGDADLAQALSELGKNLPWTAEDQLTDLFGDLAGRRIALTGQATWERAKQTAQKFHENLAEYFLEEQPMLVRPAKVTEYGEQVARLRDDVERVMKRIEKLEQAKK